MLALLLALACAPAPDPLAPLTEVLDRPLHADERALLGDGPSLWLWVGGDRMRLRKHGWPDPPENELPPPAFFDLALVEGQPPPDRQRGQLDTALYEAMLDAAEVWKRRGAGPEMPEFTGDYWLLVGPGATDATLRNAIYTAAQAQFASPRAVLLDDDPPAAPPPPYIATPGDRTTRPHPLSPIRVGWLRDAPAYTIDARPSTIRLDVPGANTHVPSGRLDDMLAALRRDPGNPQLYPSYTAAAAAAPDTVLPSVEMLIHTSKHVDEQLLLATTLAHEPERQAWVDQARAAARRDGLRAAAEWLDGAAWLSDPAGRSHAGAEAFAADPTAAPLGLWSARPDIGRLFQRDRWLQQLQKDASLVAELGALAEDRELAPGLRAWRAHRDVWTNPTVLPLVEEGDGCASCGHYLLGPGRSFETEFAKSGGVPAGGSVMSAWVAALHAGTASLDLSPDAGWHDRQVWALGPLLEPLDPHVEVGPGYRTRLDDAFVAAVAARRETQVKDLELPAIGASAATVPVAQVAPELRVEPVPEHYARQADVYRWLLDAALTPELDRLDDGPHLEALAREQRDRFDAVAAISRADLGHDGPGAELVTAAEGAATARGGTPSMTGIGLKSGPEQAPPPPPPPTVDAPVAAGVAAADDWLAAWQQDPVLSTDMRVMVPLGQDAASGRWVCLVLLGVRAIELEVGWVDPPDVRRLDGGPLYVKLLERRYTLLAPLAVEVTVDAPLSREELRALANDHERAGTLIRALEGR